MVLLGGPSWIFSSAWGDLGVSRPPRPPTPPSFHSCSSTAAVTKLGDARDWCLPCRWSVMAGDDAMRCIIDGGPDGRLSSAAATAAAVLAGVVSGLSRPAAAASWRDTQQFYTAATFSADQINELVSIPTTKSTITPDEKYRGKMSMLICLKIKISYYRIPPKTNLNWCHWMNAITNYIHHVWKKIYIFPKIASKLRQHYKYTALF